MAKVTVGKKKASAPAPAPEPVVSDNDELLGSDIGFDDLAEELSADLLEGLEGLDDIGILEVDDLGVSVEDVEAAMQSISPTAVIRKVAAPVANAVAPGISDAALAALSADVARVLKVAEGFSLGPVAEALEFQRSAIERLQSQVELLSQQVANLAEFSTDSHKTLIQAVQARTVAAPATAAPAKADSSAALDAFIRQQFDSLTTGKLYPADKVAEVFSKRNTGDAVAADKILARMQVVLADAFAKANREGYIAR